MLIVVFAFVGPLAWAPLISWKWVLVVGVGCFVLVLLLADSVYAFVLSGGSIFASDFFWCVVPLVNPLVYGVCIWVYFILGDRWLSGGWS